MPRLTEQEQQEIIRYIEADKPLPDKYRFLLFEEKREVELVRNGKTSEDIQGEFSKTFKQHLNERLGQSLETQVITKSEQKRDVSIKANVLMLKGKQVLHGTFRDITEWKRAEEEKAKLEGQLRQAHKMEAIGTLAGGIAHEFNNILGIIVGNTELAMSDVPEWNMAHKNLEEIHTACLHARDVVKQLLAFSRTSKEELKPLSLSPIVKESIKLIRSSIPTTIEIRQDISVIKDTVNADPTQINQVIINLCTNAAHAMQDKGGVLAVKLENVELWDKDKSDYPNLRTGNYIRLTVSDTGCGMTPETMKRIFDPFFTTKEVGQGTGMGLSVVHGIVKDHGGYISVHSELGKGTTFYVLFPVVESIEGPIDKPFKPMPRGIERILFVDDEETLVNAAKSNLEGLGYRIVAETNPLKALERFKAQPDTFDLLISDMAMPGMTGDRLAEAVIKIRPNIPVILCTGYSERMSENKAEEMRIKAFVMKPTLTQEMAKTIRQVLDKGAEKKAPSNAKRILVVDDEKQMRSILRQMLESAGYEVMEAPDGNVALWLFKEKKADLIITDLIMPEKEGIETIIELKNDFPQVKIIAISGGGKFEAEQYLDMAKTLGADSTLSKPFGKKELLKAVKELLG